MIDYDKIGNRIHEQRKYIMKVSQEKMAEDLAMYQADISNLEKAKSGSGITDLSKLDLIAEYFNIPLETLLFGREDKRMLTYHGDKMKLVVSRKKLTKGQSEILLRLTGLDDPDKLKGSLIECGPYTLFSMVEELMMPGTMLIEGESQQVTHVLPRIHTFVFFDGEVVGVMVSAATTVMQHVYQPVFEVLRRMIPPDVLDPTDVWRTLNPYFPLFYFAHNEEEMEQMREKMVKRMDELRQSGENRHVVYIESVYVREDCRQHGIFRMYIDWLKMANPGCIMWLNMEPTTGAELDSEYTQMSSYTISDIGQLNINAAIAEKVGFTIDPDPWHRQAEKVAADGSTTIETVLVRKCAYFLPQEIRDLIANDGDLVAQGRALQKLTMAGAEEDGIIDINHGYIVDDYVAELKHTIFGGRIYYTSAIWAPDGSKRYLVSYHSPLRDSKEYVIEEYTSLHDAIDSEYYDDLELADSFLLL